MAYLLSHNVTTPDRRRYERQLIGRYHSGLTAAGVLGYSLEECWADYCLAALWLYEYGIVTAGMDPTNERGTVFMAGMVERSALTIADLGLLRLLL